MKIGASRRVFRYSLVLTQLPLTGCGRAPAFDIMGSFFPAWLVCFTMAVLLTVVSRALLEPRIEISLPILVYPCLTALFAFALWLMLFH